MVPCNSLQILYVHQPHSYCIILLIYAWSYIILNTPGQKRALVTSTCIFISQASQNTTGVLFLEELESPCPKRRDQRSLLFSPLFASGGSKPRRLGAVLRLWWLVTRQKDYLFDFSCRKHKTLWQAPLNLSCSDLARDGLILCLHKNVNALGLQQKQDS